MKYSVAFKNLPFEPEEKQVIYVENQYNERINVLIRDNYEWLKWTFRQAGLDFVYLPMFFKDDDIREKVLYYAPYLTEEVLEQTELHNCFLLNFMSHQENREKILPSLLYAPKEENSEWFFSGLTIEIEVGDWNSTMHYFSNIISEIVEETTPVTRLRNCLYDEDLDVRFSIDDVPTKGDAHESPQVEYSSSSSFWKKFKRNIDSMSHDMIAEEEEDYERSISSVEPGLEDIREEDVDEVLEVLEKSIERLLLIGVPLGAIHEFIDMRETISRLYITDDLRIILPDYNNKEIKMTAQYKAVYLLFLYHPEGIILKRLEEYHSDLVYFYKKTSNVDKLTPKMLETINRMESIGNNYINTIFSKIRAAFIESFDKHLARHYIIQGKPGEPYRIPLDQELIIFKEDEE